jgi:hypothetical protein
MTCNPSWVEIAANLIRCQSPLHRPDIVARVFNLKRKAMMHQLTKAKTFETVVASFLCRRMAEKRP